MLKTPKEAKIPTKPALWKQIRDKVRATSEGSEPGRWSARKAALAQREYEKQGGEWKKTTASPSVIERGRKLTRNK
jgi:hypothetical protein